MTAVSREEKYGERLGEKERSQEKNVHIFFISFSRYTNILSIAFGALTYQILLFTREIQTNMMRKTSRR